MILVGGTGSCNDASKRIPPACTVLDHNLYIVDKICNLIKYIVF